MAKGFLGRMMNFEPAPPGVFDGVEEGHGPLPWFTTMNVVLAVVTAYALTFPLWGERKEANLATTYSGYVPADHIPGAAAQLPAQLTAVQNIYGNGTALATSAGGFPWWDMGYTASIVFITVVFLWVGLAIRNVVEEGY